MNKKTLSISSTGPEWYRIRSILNPKMLKLREVSAYAPIINQVVGDLLQRIELLRSRSQDSATVSNLPAELYKFGFEGKRSRKPQWRVGRYVSDSFNLLFCHLPPVGISSILFETRLGCLKEDIPQQTLRFIAAVSNMLTLSDMVILFPRWTRNILPFWRRFVQAWDDLYDIGRQQKKK